jgi:apolipoprotein N-acyltransferase
MEIQKLFWFLPVLSAVLLSLAGPSLGFWPALPVALVPLFYFLSDSSFSVSKKIKATYLFGFLFLLWQYQFFWHLLPLDWIGLTNTTSSVFLVIFFWIFLSAVNAIPSVILVIPFIKPSAHQRTKSLGVREQWSSVRDSAPREILWYLRLYRKIRGLARGATLSSKLSPLLFILLWPVSELARSFVYALLVLGNGAGVGDHFHFGFLAYAFSASNFFKSLAPWLGVFGLSLIPSLGAVFILYALRSSYPFRKTAFVFIFFCALYLFPSLPFNEEGKRDVSVLAIQADNPVLFGYTDDYFKGVVVDYEKKIIDGLLAYPETDIILLPENTYFLTGLAERDGVFIETAAKKILGTKKERLLIYGDYNKETRSAISVLAGNKGTPPLILEKSLLMPLGEYQPYLIGWLARHAGYGEWFSQVLLYRNSFATTNNQKTFDTLWGRVAVVACSEILSANVYRAIAKEDPVLIFQEQRLAHFHGNTHVFKEFLAASQIKAAMLRTPVIGSVDGSGFSYVIDSQGKIRNLGTRGDDYVFGTVTVYTNTTSSVAE